MHQYLEHSAYIDWHEPNVLTLAKELAGLSCSDLVIAQRCYAFVRDSILHSWDHRLNPVTCRASEVLQHKTGYCFAKSHLLAALLRANNIPAGLCYQRLSQGIVGPPYCLHGLNAVYLKDYGWYRIDARGNKQGITAAFSPPMEQLAFTITQQQERDLPEIWPEPHPLVVHVLTTMTTIEQVYTNLPDIELIEEAVHKNFGEMGKC